MGHELDRADTESGYAMIYAADGGTPWHRLGNLIPEEMRRDYHWCLEHMGADFEVEKVPHFVHRPIDPNVEMLTPEDLQLPDGSWVRPVKSPDAFSVVRKDRGTVIGTVGSVWQPLQTADAFRPVQKPLDDGLALIETGGVLRGGKQVWMLVRFDTEGICRKAWDLAISPDNDMTREQWQALVDALHNEVGGGILPYGLFITDFTGSMKAKVKETAIRVVCANTLDWSLGKDEDGVSIEVEHNSKVKTNYEEATQRLFGDLIRRYVKLATYREVLQQAHLPQKVFKGLVLDRAYPVKHLEARIQRREGTAHTVTALEKAGEKRSRIQALWDGEGDGLQGDHTAWDGYNAAVQFIDHDERAMKKGGNRVQSLIGGSLGYMKKMIFRDLLDYSGADGEEKEAILASVN